MLQVIDTRRLNPHSKGDDTRPGELIEQLWRDDPLNRQIESDPAAAERFAFHRRAVTERIKQIEAEPRVAGAVERSSAFAAPPSSSPVSQPGDTDTRIADLLNGALNELMADSESVVVLGEDLLDPYGGAFKVTRGLSTSYPQRVFSTPIAESAIVGTANGLALAGMRPIAEIMFSDFATLAADQIVNHLSKFFYMYGGKQTCPAVVRLVSGGGRGYGPTHSQSMETLFLGVPGLRVVALSRRHDPGRLLKGAVLDNSPVVFVEPKLLYAQPPQKDPPLGCRFQPPQRGVAYPALGYRPDDDDAEVTIVTYGRTTDICESAMRTLLIDEEIACDYFVVTQLSPLEIPEIVASVRRTGRLVTVEEGPGGFGFGAGVVAHVSASAGRAIRARCVAAAEVPLPADRQLEASALPDEQSIIHAVEHLLEE
jgi:2-oxoisovalerate dehydrogenase E1 component